MYENTKPTAQLSMAEDRRQKTENRRDARLPSSVFRLLLPTAAYLLASIFPAKAQFREMPFQNNYPVKYSSVSTTADLSFNSNTITNTFFNEFYLKKSFLEESLKEDQSSKLNNNNRMGADIDIGAYYEHRNDTSKNIFANFFVAVRDREHADARFTKDAFDLVFYGNKKLAGKTADLSDFSLNVLKYQQLQFGWMKRYDVPQSSISKGEEAGVMHNKHYTIGAAVSLLKGQQNLSISTNKASLFTEQNGEYIDLTANAQYAQADTTHKNLDAWNGTGASLDFYFVYSKDSTQTIRFEVNDLGYIWWNKKATTASIDTSYHFEGLDVSSIFNFHDSVNVLSLDIDSVYSTNKQILLTHKKTGIYKTFLPVQFHLSFEKNIIPETLTLQAGMKYRLAANYSPYIYITTDYYFTSKFMASLHLAQGGYGNFHFGLGIATDFGHGFILSLGTNYLDGITGISPTGQGAYLSFQKLFF